MLKGGGITYQRKSVFDSALSLFLAARLWKDREKDKKSNKKYREKVRRKDMFQFLFIFGPAAITYLVAEKCSKKKASGWRTSFIELLCYGFLDAVITIGVLYPLGKVKMIALPDGVNTVQYGYTALIFSVPVAVVCGIAAAVYKKKVQMHIEIEPVGKDTGKDEKRD